MSARAPAATPSIQGFVRPDGSVGTRNLLLVVSMSDLCNDIALRIGRAAPGSAALLTPAGGLSFGEEARLIARLQSRLCANPNVGAVLAVGPIPAETVALVAEARDRGRFADATSLLDHVDSHGAARAGVRIGRQLLRLLAPVRRRRVPIDALRLGLKSSVSSAESVRFVNPAVGRLVDLVAGHGGQVAVTELADLCGAAAALVARSATPEVARAVAEALDMPRRLLKELGSDAPDPTPMNLLGGLATIERKSRGALKRLGRSSIRYVISFGEELSGSGLHLMTGPGSCAVSLLGLAAAGCTVIAHSVGLTGATAASPLVPMIKIGGPGLRASRDLDLCIEDRNDAHGRNLAEIALQVASGARTASERIGERAIMLPSTLPPL